jgi:P-type E1-E2 ATPase
MGDAEICWSELRVGDLIKVEKNEFFPCDVLLVNTSEPKGVCYIETKNLDGETNLK